jgi:energy-coupling factor transporter ATP-binding protein EcfA2
MTNSIIELEDVAFGYSPGRLVLSGVNLSIRPGEMTALIGSNGSGKSTLMKLIVGLIRPTVGAVRLNGQDTGGMRVSELAQQIGFIFQNPNDQLFAQTVEDEIRFGLRNLKLAETIVQQRLEETLERFGLSDQRGVFPRFLSRGDRQKVCIASIVAMRPNVLLLDEPTTGQDYRDSRAILELASELNQAGMTILLVTHDLINVAAYARRVVVLNDGDIVKDAPTLEVLTDSTLLETCHLVAPGVVTISQRLHDLEIPTALTPDQLISSISSRFDSARHR